MSDPKTMSGSEYKLHSEATKQIAEMVAKEMRLRQWCVEQACKMAGNPELGPESVTAIITLTQCFYNFIANKESSDEK